VQISLKTTRSIKGSKGDKKPLRRGGNVAVARHTVATTRAQAEGVTNGLGR